MGGFGCLYRSHPGYVAGSGNNGIGPDGDLEAGVVGTDGCSLGVKDDSIFGALGEGYDYRIYTCCRESDVCCTVVEFVFVGINGKGVLSWALVEPGNTCFNLGGIRHIRAHGDFETAGLIVYVVGGRNVDGRVGVDGDSLDEGASFAAGKNEENLALDCGIGSGYRNLTAEAFVICRNDVDRISVIFEGVEIEGFAFRNDNLVRCCCGSSGGNVLDEALVEDKLELLHKLGHRESDGFVVLEGEDKISVFLGNRLEDRVCCGRAGFYPGNAVIGRNIPFVVFKFYLWGDGVGANLLISGVEEPFAVDGPVICSVFVLLDGDKWRMAGLTVGDGIRLAVCKGDSEASVYGGYVLYINLLIQGCDDSGDGSEVIVDDILDSENPSLVVVELVPDVGVVEAATADQQSGHRK